MTRLFTDTRTHRPLSAFSLAELMIAIVILGVGLLMVASMFPIAWMKARDQVESSQIATATDTAEAILVPNLELKIIHPDAARWIKESCEDGNEPTDNPACDPCGPNNKRPARYVGCFAGRSSFLSDLGVLEIDNVSLAYHGTDNRVHPINMYNMLANPASYEGERPETFGDNRTTHYSFVDYDCAPFDKNPDDKTNCEGEHTPFIAENTYNSDYVPPSFNDSDYADHYFNYYGTGLPIAQVNFENRVIPAMPAYPSKPDNDVTGSTNWGTVKDSWMDELRTRRYAWAVLARMNNGAAEVDILDTDTHKYEGIGYELYDESTSTMAPNSAMWQAPRVFTFFYATVKRAQESFRFPRQAYNNYSYSGGISAGDDNLVGAPRSVYLVKTNNPDNELEDIVPAALPPNRDTVFPVPWRIPVKFYPPAAPGVPSQAEINNAVSAYLLPRGAYMIEEETGIIYKVASHKQTGSGAILTLDKSFVPTPDLDPSNTDPAWSNVWVYPPPVDNEGRHPTNISTTLVAAGGQPVLGIEIRTTVLHP